MDAAVGQDVSCVRGKRGFGLRLCALLVPALLLGACGGSDRDKNSPEACRFAVTQDLDAGHYDRALERIDSRACEASMSANERELNRAAAWIGKAGYDFADIIDAILGEKRPDNDEPRATQVLRLLRGKGVEPAGLTLLDKAAAAHGRMVAAFPDGLNEACQAGNVHLLDSLQRDACFTSGLFAYARFVRGVDLLLSDELNHWFRDEPLTCASDRNQSGMLDQSEITACAIRVRDRLDEDGGTCQEAGTSGDATTGAVTWERLAAHDPLVFRDGISPFAELRPARITVAAGSACQLAGDRSSLRLIQQQPTPAAPAGSERFCEVDTRRACAAADPAAGCWPCPLVRADRSGAITSVDAVVDAINFMAEHLRGVLPPDEVARYQETLDGVRADICTAVEEDAEWACERREDGSRQINQEALAAFLRR